MGIADDIRKPKKPGGFLLNEPEITESANKPAEEGPEEEPKKATESINPEKEERKREILEDQFFSSIPKTKDKEATKKNITLSGSGSSFAKVFFWLLVFSSLIAAAILQNPLRYLEKTSTENSAKSQQYAGEVVTQDEIKNQEEIVAAATEQGVAAVAEAIPTEPVIDKTTISIKVLNGNGQSGSAAGVKDQLTTAGFVVAATANAKRFTYAQTSLYYRTGKEAEAKLVQEALGNRQIALELSDSIVGNYDVVVVVGKK